MPPHQAGSSGAGYRVPVSRPGGLPGRGGVVAALGTQELPQQTPPRMRIGASHGQSQVPPYDPAAGYPPGQVQPHDQVSALKPRGGTPHEDALDDPGRAARAFPHARTAIKFRQVKPQGAGQLTAQGGLPRPAAADDVNALRFHKYASGVAGAPDAPATGSGGAASRNSHRVARAQARARSSSHHSSPIVRPRSRMSLAWRG